MVKGRILIENAAGTKEVLSVGNDGQFLKANSSATLGVEWATVSGGGGFDPNAANDIIPATNDTYSLGSASYTWNRIHLGSDNQIRASSTVKFRNHANSGYVGVRVNSFNIGDTANGFDSGGNAICYQMNLTGPNGAFPNTDNGASLGTSTNGFRALYLGSSSSNAKILAGGDISFKNRADSAYQNIDVGSLKIGGSEVISSSRRLRNVAAQGISGRYLRSGTTRERWMTSPTTHTAMANGAAVVNGRMYCYPFPCPHDMNVTKLACYVATSATNGEARLGIYTDTGNAEPYQLVTQGTVGTTSTGVKTTSVSASLVGGEFYWLCIHVNNATNAFRGAPIAAQVNILGYATTLGTTDAISGVYADQTYGSLPSTFPTPTGNLVNATMNCVWVGH